MLCNLLILNQTGIRTKNERREKERLRWCNRYCSITVHWSFTGYHKCNVVTDFEIGICYTTFYTTFMIISLLCMYVHVCITCMSVYRSNKGFRVGYEECANASVVILYWHLMDEILIPAHTHLVFLLYVNQFVIERSQAWSCPPHRLLISSASCSTDEWVNCTFKSASAATLMVFINSIYFPKANNIVGFLWMACLRLEPPKWLVWWSAKDCQCRVLQLLKTRAFSPLAI